MKKAVILAAVAGLPLTALPLTALAQTPEHGHGITEAAALKNSKDVEAHIASLHAQLQITPAEEGNWGAFAQVMRDNASQMEAAFAARGQGLATYNAEQNLDSYAHISQLQSDDMMKLASAFQALYASFPPAQQKLADGVFRAEQARH